MPLGTLLPWAPNFLPIVRHLQENLDFRKSDLIRILSRSYSWIGRLLA